jgi:RimJ/RimL family protein N-acetyltransferase
VLIGEKVLLRARTRDDVVALYHIRKADPELFQKTEKEPWVPQPLEQDLARYDARLGEPPDPLNTVFAVEARVAAGRIAHGDVVGEATCWGIDNHNGAANIGLRLVEEARGLGFGTDVVRMLCDYGFRLRGMYRLTCATLASNVAMIRVAEKAGFVAEARLRSAAFVDGHREDVVYLGLLREDWG